MALGARLAGRQFKVFVLVGDGELQEGQNWEGLAAAAKYGLDNLVVIVDRNGVQLDGPVDEIMPLGDLAGKLKEFGFEVQGCEGHDCGELLQAFSAAGVPNGRPKAIIARTVKGKGVSFMEGQSVWHGKPLLAEDYARAKAEMGAFAGAD
jgi:transketolase